MNDVLLLIAEQLLLRPDDPSALLSFVKLQATSRCVWFRYRNDTDLWRRLGSSLPTWSLPDHMGLRRRVITGIKLMMGRCIACGGKATRVFMAFQARICRKCCHRLLISDHELAWTFGLCHASPPYIVRYAGETRVRFFMRQHLKLPAQPSRLSPEQVFAFMRQWPGLQRGHIRQLIDKRG